MRLTQSRSFRFTPRDLDLLGRLAEQDTDGNQSLVLRKLIRREAKRRGILRADGVTQAVQDGSILETEAA